MGLILWGDATVRERQPAIHWAGVHFLWLCSRMRGLQVERGQMRRFLLGFLVTVVVGSMTTAECAAQARYQMFAGYSYLSNSFNGVDGSHQPLNGWDFSFAFPAWHGLRFKVDTTGYRGTNLNAPQHAYFIMGGGEYGHRFGRETLYVEGLGGDGGLNRYWGANQTPGQTASFVAFMGGGVDTPISKRFAWRGLRFKVDTTGYRGTNLNAPQHAYFIMGGGEYGHRFGREKNAARPHAGRSSRFCFLTRERRAIPTRRNREGIFSRLSPTSPLLSYR